MLVRCLDRLQNGAQTLPGDQYEVIVSDDGGPATNARTLVESRYPGVQWIQGPSRGPAANRNAGAARGRGAWLAFTDDDCIPESGWLEAFARRMDVGGGRILEGRTDCGTARIGPFEQAPGNDKGGLLWSCNLAVERELFESMGGFDAGFPFPHLEDVDFRLRLDDAGERYIFVPEACVLHPPRPIGSALNWARAQESSFYLARKRGVPLAAVNFGFGTYARLCVRCFRMCNGFGEALRLAWRIAEEVALISVYLPRFMLKYRLK